MISKRRSTIRSIVPRASERVGRSWAMWQNQFVALVPNQEAHTGNPNVH